MQVWLRIILAKLSEGVNRCLTTDITSAMQAFAIYAEEVGYHSTRHVVEGFFMSCSFCVAIESAKMLIGCGFFWPRNCRPACFRWGQDRAIDRWLCEICKITKLLVLDTVLAAQRTQFHIQYNVYNWVYVLNYIHSILWKSVNRQKKWTIAVKFTHTTIVTIHK